MRIAVRPVSVRFIFIIPLLFITLLPVRSVPAEIKTIEADNIYAMGDNDSRVDARRIATQEAKRKALELAGTYVASLTQVKDYQLTKDEVTAYTAGVVETELMVDEMRGTTERPEVYIKVRCRIDTAVLVQQIDRYRESQELREELEASAKEKEALRKERDELQKLLAAEKDKGKAEQTRAKLSAVLTHEETIDTTNRVWARLSPEVDFYSGGEINRAVKLAELEDSAAMLEKAVELNPRNQRANILLASLYEQRSDKTKAEQHLRRALEREPGNQILRMRLGILLREAGNYREALREFGLVERKQPQQPHMLLQTGLTHQANGNCRLAAGYMKRLLLLKKRNDRQDVAKLKAKAQQVLDECGTDPSSKKRAHKRRQ
jgi:tetratricopeptide (TPR) repeat protein